MGSRLIERKLRETEFAINEMEVGIKKGHAGRKRPARIHYRRDLACDNEIYWQAVIRKSVLHWKKRTKKVAEAMEDNR